MTKEYFERLGRTDPINKVKVSNSWGMFTPAGNKRIKQLAEVFLNKARNCTGLIAFTRCSQEFIKKWSKLSSLNSYREASDTAVREEIWDFFKEIGKARGYDYPVLEIIWDEVY